MAIPFFAACPGETETDGGDQDGGGDPQVARAGDVIGEEAGVGPAASIEELLEEHGCLRLRGQLCLWLEAFIRSEPGPAKRVRESARNVSADHTHLCPIKKQVGVRGAEYHAVFTGGSIALPERQDRGKA